MIKSISTNDVKSSSSSVSSFKCTFCDAYIFTLQSFIIHLKSSHSNEDLSTMLNDDYCRSCLTMVEKEKVVIVTYAFPTHRDIDQYWNMNSALSNSNISPYLSISIKRSTVIEQELLNDCITITNAGTVIIQQNLPYEKKIYTSNSLPAVLTANTRRRQISKFDKIMALTCQKCGQKFKNRCMLTRHDIEHKRAKNPYRCAIEGCLDSFTEKRRLIAHLNYKHTDLPKKERKIMIMNGDKSMRKLQNISLKEATTTPTSTCSSISSRISPIASSVASVVVGRLHHAAAAAVASPQPQTISIAATTTTNNNDQSLSTTFVPLSPVTTDVFSANHILRNMVENVECERNVIEDSLQTAKTGMHTFQHTISITPYH